MTNQRGKVCSFLGWILFIALLLGVKYRREQAYWQEVTDKIVSQLQPPRKILNSDGQRSEDDQNSPDGVVMTVDGAPPAGMKSSSAAADTASAPQLARRKEVIP